MRLACNNAFGFMHDKKDQQLERRISMEMFHSWMVDSLTHSKILGNHTNMQNYNSRKL